MTYSELKSKADYYLKEWGDEKETCPASEIPLLIALTFDPLYIDNAIQMSAYWLQKCLKAKIIDYKNYGTFSFIMNFASTLHLFGNSQDDLFKTISKSSPPPDTASKAHHKLLNYYLNGDYPSNSVKKKKKEDISFENLPNRISQVSIDSLYRFVLDTNTPGWHDRIQPYFQLISLLHFQSDGISEQNLILKKLKEDFLKQFS